MKERRCLDLGDNFTGTFLTISHDVHISENLLARAVLEKWLLMDVVTCGTPAPAVPSHCYLHTNVSGVGGLQLGRPW